MAYRGADIAKRGREGQLRDRLDHAVGLGPAALDHETEHIAEAPAQKVAGAGVIGVIGAPGIQTRAPPPEGPAR